MGDIATVERMELGRNTVEHKTCQGGSESSTVLLASFSIVLSSTAPTWKDHWCARTASAKSFWIGGLLSDYGSS